MNVLLWVAAALLAAAFAAAGLTKLTQPQEKLRANMGWFDDYSANAVKLIGGLEVLAAIGLIVPPLLGFAQILAPLAATGLVLIMIGAIVTHVRRGEIPLVAVNVVLLVLAAFVAWGRFGPHSFS